MTRRRIQLTILVVVFGGAISVKALNGPSHGLINRAASGEGTSDVYSNAFDNVLRESLGLPNGRDTVVRTPDLTVIDFLAEGGEREDDGLPFSAKARVYRHFHNPLLPWDAAGLLTRYPFRLQPHQYTSSVRWMQADDQAADDGGAAGGAWAWRDARRLQYLVLTTDDARQREAYAADLFRALGQIMHLVVDASVPEHVRNDPHPLGTFTREVLRSRTAGNYEYWVSAQQARLGDAEFTARYLSMPIAPAVGVLGLPPPHGEAVATRPVARLIDADRYLAEAPDPEVTLSDPIGIAEFANANFFSEDTLFAADSQGRPLPFPRRDALVRRVDRAPSRSGNRTYFEKRAGQGLVTRFALAECRLDGRAVALQPYPCMDEAVWEETATHMLPRAVGYARGVLEYFFRGRVRVRTSLMRAGVPVIQIDNLTNEAMSGVFEIFGRPEGEESGEGRERTAVVNGGAAASIAPYGSVALPITYRQAERPTPSQILVFRGRIGLEEDAVAAQTFTVPHILIAQTGHTADLLERCETRFEFPFRTELEWCSWNPTTLVTDGSLIGSPWGTVMARVSVSAPFPGTELVLDGAPVPGGVWQRRADEPDPRAFSIRWSRLTTGVVGQPLPTLTVQLIDGTVVTSRVYGSIVADAEARKSYTASPAGSDPPWYVAARRSASVQVSLSTSYRLVSIGGYPNPTYISIDRYAVPSLVETIEADDTVRGDIVGYLQRWTDHATVYRTAPQGGPVLLQKPLREEFEALSYGPVPKVPIEAVLERVNRPGELEFLHAFVTREPPPSTLTVVGRREAAP